MDRRPGQFQSSFRRGCRNQHVRTEPDGKCAR